VSKSLLKRVLPSLHEKKTRQARTQADLKAKTDASALSGEEAAEALKLG